MTSTQRYRPERYRTNPIQRPNGEIKRRADVVGGFRNEVAIRRIVGANLMEQTKDLTLPCAGQLDT